MNQIYGFEGEVKAKYTAQMYELFSEVFEWLPLAQCINGKVLVRTAAKTPTGSHPHPTPATHRGCMWAGVLMKQVRGLGYGWCLPSHNCSSPKPQIMHGGLFSEDGVTLDDIRKIERNRQPPDSGDGRAG